MRGEAVEDDPQAELVGVLRIVGGAVGGARGGADPGGQRVFQVRDPNGVIIELLDWKAAG